MVRLKGRLKIKHKLFCTLLVTSTIVAGGLFLFLQWSFDRGFLDYLHSQEYIKLTQLADYLKSSYRKNGDSWSFIDNNLDLWVKIHDEVLYPKGRAPMGPPRRPDGRVETGPPRRPEEFGQSVMNRLKPHDLRARLILFDAEKRRVVGGPLGNIDIDVTFRPITLDQKTIGHLGLIPAGEFTYSGDLLFVEQQTETFALVTLAMFGLSILLSFPLTIHLLRPILQLTDGTMKLINGKFSTRIPVTTGDELGQLSNNFNILAMTLERNEASRKQWVADVSHELRTPLAVLRGEVEALQDGVRPVGPDTIDPLHGEIMHLQRLVNDLYELSMSDIGALTYRKILVNPLGILESTLELFEQRFSAKDILVSSKLPQEYSGLMLGDPDRLQQLFTNLLENSLRYTNSEGKLVVEVTEENERVTLVFEDSAPGVTPSQIPKLFERLYRADSSRKRLGSGAGLGLSICNNIVEAHQGTIEASSSELGGLKVKVEFPLNS